MVCQFPLNTQVCQKNNNTYHPNLYSAFVVPFQVVVPEPGGLSQWLSIIFIGASPTTEEQALFSCSVCSAAAGMKRFYHPCPKYLFCPCITQPGTGDL